MQRALGFTARRRKFLPPAEVIVAAYSTTDLNRSDLRLNCGRCRYNWRYGQRHQSAAEPASGNSERLDIAARARRARAEECQSKRRSQRIYFTRRKLDVARSRPRAKRI